MRGGIKSLSGSLLGCVRMSKMSEIVNSGFSRRELVGIKQSLEDEIEILKDRRKNGFLERDKADNRIIICEHALKKVSNVLSKRDFNELEKK